MTKIYYLMGKSATGKDTVFKELLSRHPELKTIVMYTTRPIRDGERDGVEYYFTNQKKLEELSQAGKVIELRTYETVHGPWSYFTADDGQFDLESGQKYLMIGTLDSYEKMCRYFGNEVVAPLYLELPDGERLMRALKREEKQSELGIQKRFSNMNLEHCVKEIIREL